jgi:hypothetical protein
VRINQIRALIQTEEDNKKFTALVIELNELLEAREHRSAEDSKRDPLCAVPAQGGGFQRLTNWILKLFLAPKQNER